LEICGITDLGKKREKNEDSILIDEELRLFVVADGMGGHIHGEVASQTAVRAIGDFVRRQMSTPGGAATDPRVFLEEAVCCANREIHEQSRRLQGNVMGTTVSLLFLRGEKAYITHVGDSVIFRSRNGNLEKLTKDHNRAQELLDARVITAEEVGMHPASHVLTRVLGPSDSISPDIGTTNIRKGDVFLLSTDGLFRVLTADDARDVLSGRQPVAEKSRILVERALEGGAPDNVSVILVEIKRGFLGRIFFGR
jgi:serine/threonine protein phosphatase PrpC